MKSTAEKEKMITKTELAKKLGGGLEIARKRLKEIKERQVL